MIPVQEKIEVHYGEKCPYRDRATDPYCIVRTTMWTCRVPFPCGRVWDCLTGPEKKRRSVLGE